jgi:hypothetical protein
VKRGGRREREAEWNGELVRDKPAEDSSSHEEKLAKARQYVQDVEKGNVIRTEAKTKRSLHVVRS